MSLQIFLERPIGCVIYWDEYDAAITATDAFIDGQPKLDDEDNDIEEICKKLADSVRFFE